jgi:hypothetical protein
MLTKGGEGTSLGSYYSGEFFITIVSLLGSFAHFILPHALTGSPRVGMRAQQVGYRSLTNEFHSPSSLRPLGIVGIRGRCLAGVGKRAGTEW